MKDQISPHDSFFSTNIIRDIRDKYELCAGLTLILQSAFCRLFWGGRLTLDYDYTCSETDFTQEKSHFHQLIESSFTAAALSQNGRIAVSRGVKSYETSVVTITKRA